MAPVTVGYIVWSSARARFCGYELDAIGLVSYLAFASIRSNGDQDILVIFFVLGKRRNLTYPHFRVALATICAMTPGSISFWSSSSRHS